MRITQGVGDYAARHGTAEVTAVIAQALREKAEEFRKKRRRDLPPGVTFAGWGL